jgi:hypothetical protein
MVTLKKLTKSEKKEHFYNDKILILCLISSEKLFDQRVVREFF